MPFDRINPEELSVAPLSQRFSKSSIEEIAVDPEAQPQQDPALAQTAACLAGRIRQARDAGAAVMLAYGAHLIKNGAGPILIRLMEQGWLTHLATQGAGCIHDWEFAYLGRSEEDVRANVADGTFGAWDETGKYLHLAAQTGALQGMGYGEAVGLLIDRESLALPNPSNLADEIRSQLSRPEQSLAAMADLYTTMKRFDLKPGLVAVPHRFKKYSVLAAAHRLQIPLTVHAGIGYDIIYNHPLANGGALGRASHIDFQIFVNSAARLTGGVFMSVGSAIMAPQVFEKALSAANNLRRQTHQPFIQGHHIAVNDLQPVSWDWSRGEPLKSSPDYYLRFLKSFHRMGGSVEYIQADNRRFLHHLYHALKA